MSTPIPLHRLVCPYCERVLPEGVPQRHLSVRICDDMPEEEPRYACIDALLVDVTPLGKRDADRMLDALCVRVRSARGDAGVDFVGAL